MHGVPCLTLCYRHAWWCYCGFVITHQWRRYGGSSLHILALDFWSRPKHVKNYSLFIILLASHTSSRALELSNTWEGPLDDWSMYIYGAERDGHEDEGEHTWPWWQETQCKHLYIFSCRPSYLHSSSLCVKHRLLLYARRTSTSIIPWSRSRETTTTPHMIDIEDLLVSFSLSDVVETRLSEGGRSKRCTTTSRCPWCLWWYTNYTSTRREFVDAN